MGIKEAIEKAKKLNPNYNRCIEHSNAWAFNIADDEECVGGPNAGIVVMKDDGRVLRMYEYYMTDLGESEIISEHEI